jgi:hypothetical protein
MRLLWTVRWQTLVLSTPTKIKSIAGERLKNRLRQRPDGIDIVTPSKNILVFEPAAVRNRQTAQAKLACQRSNCAMKRRRKVPCDHPTTLGLTQQYEEVLRLRHQVGLAETDQHAASQPSDAERADACSRQRPERTAGDQT